MYYLLYDKELASEGLFYGLFDDIDKAVEAKNELSERFADECLAEAPEESGLTFADRGWLVDECKNSIGLIEIQSLNKISLT